MAQFLTKFLLRLALDTDYYERFSSATYDRKDRIMWDAELQEDQIAAVKAVLNREPDSEKELQAKIIAESDNILSDINCGKIRTFVMTLEEELFEEE
jgi:hypothetical protein